MFARLGPWCHDNRWKVVIGWVRAAVRRQRRRRRGRRGLPAGLLAQRLRVHRGLHPRGGGVRRRQRLTAVRPDRVPGRAGRRPTPRSRRRWRSSSPRSRRSTTSPRCRARTRRVASSRSPRQGAAAGTIAYATVNLPEDIDFTRAAEISDEIEELVPEQDGLRVELGGYLFAEFEPAAVGAVRPRLRHHHPDRRVRLRPGDGPADRHRARRHRPRRGGGDHREPPPRGPRLRTVHRRT